MRTSQGQFIPYRSAPVTAHPLNNPPITSSQLPSPGRQQLPPAPSDPITRRPVSPAQEDEWDPWPDEVFEMDVTWPEFERTKQLHVHWSCRVTGGDRKGDEMAGTWEAGKRSTRTCQGFIACDVDTCSTIARPQTTPQGIAGQLLRRCHCNGKLIHYSCGVKSTLHKWSGGVHFSNLGQHEHPRLTHVLHVSTREQARFEEIVAAHPGTRSLGLIVGVPGIHGPGESVADISPVYLNADRVQKERDKVKRGDGQGGDGFIAEFAEFAESHPDFVIFSQLGAVTVICFQTPFMASQLLKTEPLTGSVNGLVSDAAHGWWLLRTSLLIITSAYCAELHCWVPGIFSYSNGASAAHYECHFYALLESIAHHTELRNVEVTDRLFAGIADFSEAERAGFCAAFIRFWTVRPGNTRTQEELGEAFKAIYRGCAQHFRAGITRVKKISGVVPPDQAEAFQFRVLALLDAADSEEFQARAAAVIRDFPKTESWLRWWMRESHAVMLFASERRMDPDVWDSIPDSTNAEEAFHWKLYCALGRLHALMEGFRGLFAVAGYYQRLYTGTIAGIPIRYGQAESWKVIAQIMGRTKPSRAPDASSSKRSKNDGRAPDTSAELLGSSKAGQNGSKAGSKTRPKDREVSYPWSKNSCWLDSGLELLFHAVMRNPVDFSFSFEDVNPECAITPLFKIMNLRKTLLGSGEDPSAMLSLQRDGFRDHLKLCRLITSTNEFDSIIAWLPGIFKHKHDASSRSAEAYFHSKIVTVRSCTGSGPSAIHKHIQISCAPVRKYVHVLHLADAKKFDNPIKLWLQNEILVNKTPVKLARCWCNRDGVQHCSGAAHILSFTVSLPVVLILEVNEELGNDAWDFPPVLQLSRNNTHIAYDIVGRGLYSRAKTHFIARYCNADKSAVYTYDDMKDGGFSVRERGKGRLKTHLCGANIEVPAGFKTSIVIYHLQGGLEAQEIFAAAQMKGAQRIHHLRFIRNPMPSVTLERAGFQRIEDSNRAWMTNPYKGQTADYRLDGTDAGSTVAVADRGASPSADESEANRTPPANVYSPPGFVDGSDSEDETGDKSAPPEDLSPSHSHLELPLDDRTEELDDDDPMPPSQSESEFPFSCRCGAQGPDGSIFTVDDPAIQCDRCKDWSHVSCQRDGRAYNNKRSDLFECDYCIQNGVLPDLHMDALDGVQQVRTSKRLHVLLFSMETIRPCIILMSSNSPGKGVLVKNGKYYYPARLIRCILHSKLRTYAVKWWRECKFHRSAVLGKPGEISVVPEAAVVDDLWGNLQERRKIRLGQWTHACEVLSAEDILADPGAVSYQKEIETVLVPHCTTLQDLLTSPETFDILDIPALQNLSHANGSMGPSGAEAGDLSVLDQAQVMNWFERHVANGDKAVRSMWVGRIPLAHAYTLLFAHRYYHLIIAEKDCPAAEEERKHRRFVLQAAWEYQSRASPGKWNDLDVDQNCLSFLEERMFENSERAGFAGTGQWGLDAGVHQGRWFPYGNLPSAWSKDDAPEVNELDLAVSGYTFDVVHDLTAFEGGSRLLGR
ncbi:hypothetical protein DFH09DRAFT_1047292 [Mycena vulgaris]|nr:hypothetical protein DFH09DRAFT_1047292 [Mycena vulgaris]